jgi:hypothetical protein
MAAKKDLTSSLDESEFEDTMLDDEALLKELAEQRGRAN